MGELGPQHIGIYCANAILHNLPGMGKIAAERFDRLLKPWLECEDVGKMSAEIDRDR